MPCTRSTSPAPRMAGSARATRWRCGGHRGASASTSTRRSTWRISTALWSRPSGSMPPPPSRCSRSWRPATPARGGSTSSSTTPVIITPVWSGSGWRDQTAASRSSSLPAHAPHLNAIERLWPVMHREVTHNKFPWSRGEARWLGALWASLRFLSPLIKPDVRISRIRLPDRLHLKAHGGGPRWTRRRRITPSSPNTTVSGKPGATRRHLMAPDQEMTYSLVRSSIPDPGQPIRKSGSAFALT